MNWGFPVRSFARTSAIILALTFANFACAETILKLDLGNDSQADIQYDGATISTTLDIFNLTPGDQNTTVDFLGFLSSITPNPMPNASFSLSNVAKSGSATVLVGPNLVVQEFTGGDYFIYDDNDDLLLTGMLGNSSLSGPLGPPATGALFTTTFGSVTGGSLADLIEPNSLSLSMSMTDINGGAGFSVTNDELDPFTTDVTLNMAAEQAVPEPTSAVLAMLGCLLVTFAFRRRA
jgi:hypothetical protein